MTTGADKEALRQQMLLRALWRDAPPAVVGGWLRGTPARIARGLQAYQAHAGALAERALAAAYPTLAELIGEESFAALARHFWQDEPPACGDIARWGAGLPAFVATAPSLAGEPYLADVARIDWAVHEAASAADAGDEVEGLDLLAATDPAALRLVLCPGTAMVVSPHPVVTIWEAHRSPSPAGFDAARRALQAGSGEAVRIRREGFVVRVDVVGPADARFTAAVLAGAPLAAALDAVPGLDFEAWLLDALRQRWLRAVQLDAPGDTLVA